MVFGSAPVAVVGRVSSRKMAILMTTAAVAAFSLAMPAMAQNERPVRLAQASQPGVRQFDIVAQPLATAINAFGRQSGLQVTAEADVTAGVQAQAVSGDYTPVEALSRLLSGTGVTWRMAGDSIVVLTKAPQTSGAAIQLGPVRVEGQESNSGGPSVYSEEATAVSHVEGYVARRTATGTKTDTPLVEIPQSISVVTSDQIREQKAQSLQDALSYTAGVMTGTAGMNPALADSFWIRGFQADSQFASFYRDGLRFGARIFNGKQEPYGLERVEVLKGPSSILYGAAAPGGIVNTISKRPTQIPLHEINLEYGTFDRKQVSADFSGPIDGEGRWAYRLTALGRDSDTFIDFGRDDRIYIAPALTWTPSDRTSLTLLTHYQHFLGSDTASLPVIGTLYTNPNGRIPRSRYLGEPDHNNYDNEEWSLGYEFRQKLSDSITFNHNLRYLRIDLDFDYVLLNGILDPTQRLAGRDSRHFKEKTTALTLDNNLAWNVATGPVEHKILLGLDYSRTRYNSIRDRGALNPIDIYAPVYGVSHWLNLPWRWFIDTDTRTGIYLQDQMKLNDKLIVLLGGRHDWFKIDSQTPYTPQDNVVERQSAFTGRAGLVYVADNGIAPYLSYSQSFEPTSGRDRLNNRFKPTRGEQFEAGLRYQPGNGNIMLSAAIYQLTRTNVTTPDPVDTSFLVQTGEVRARGVELEAKAQVATGLNLVGAYTYTDTKVTESNNPAQLGTRFQGVPRNMVSLWADYDFTKAGLNGFSLGGGIRYVSLRPGDLTGAVDVPSYTLFDAVATYKTGPWRFSINARNLTDKTYFPNNCRTTASGGCDYGAPRTIIATLGYNW